MSNAKELLISALMQYRHNNSDDFVAAFEFDETIEIVDILLAQRDQAQAEIALLREQLAESRRNDMHSMSWLVDARMASGDEGKRMLPDFIEYLKNLKSGRDELLEALKAMVREYEGYFDGAPEPDSLRNARAAIAKAKGE